MQLLSLIAMASAVSALPNGAPKCQINQTVIAIGLGNETALGYSIVPTQVNATTFKFKIANAYRKTCFEA